jgi:hypothetical protein
MKPVFKEFVDEGEIEAPKSGWTPIKQQTIIEDFNKDKKYSFKTLKEVLVEGGLVEETPKEVIEENLEPVLTAYKELFIETVQVPEPVVEQIANEEVVVEPKVEESKPVSLVDAASDYITKRVKIEEADSFQQPVAPNIPNNLTDINKRVRYLEQWLAKVSMAGPGSGSYWLYDLSDTNYDIVKNPNNNDVLVYNSSNAKWEVGTVSNILGNRYHGSYFSNVNQTSANTSLSYFITINNTDFQNGFTTDGANIIAQHSGVYNLQFSNQLHYTGGGGSGNTVEIWLTKNGVNKEDTNTRVNLLSSSPYVVAAWNFLVSMDAGDKVALKWATDNLNIRFEASSGSVGPRVPSVVMTIAQV